MPADHHRRLLSMLGFSSSRWRFQRWPVQWPHPAVFRAEVMHCRSAASGFPDLFLGTAYQLFKVIPNATLSQTRRLGLEALSAQSFPASSVLLCGENQVECLQASLTDRALHLIRGAPWRRVAGVQVPCKNVEALLTASQPGRLDGRCLLLAGWDGSRLPVAILRWPVEGPWKAVSPIFDVPLKIGNRKKATPGEAQVCQAQEKRQVLSMSLEPQALRLWALAGQELWGWDLLSGRVLGHWPLPDFQRDFEPTALCAGARASRHPRLMLAGRIAAKLVFWRRLRRAPDGLFIWASGDEVWEFFMAGSKQPDEVIRAEVFVEEKTPGAARPDNRSKRRTGHFEVDLESQSQRLVSHFFTPSKATESICSVGKMKLTLVASWVRKGTQTELRKCTKEVRKMVDEVLVEAEQAAVEGQREEPLQPVRLRPKVSQWKRAEPVEDTTALVRIV
eukprot:g15732.t1